MFGKDLVALAITAQDDQRDVVLPRGAAHEIMHIFPCGLAASVIPSVYSTNRSPGASLTIFCVQRAWSLTPSAIPVGRKCRIGSRLRGSLRMKPGGCPALV